MTVDIKIDAKGVKRAAGRAFEVGRVGHPSLIDVGLPAAFTGRADPSKNITEDIPAAVRRILDEPEDTLVMAQSRERYWSRRCADAEAERDAAAALARDYRDEIDAVRRVTALRSVPIMDPIWSAGYNAALDQVIRAALPS